MNDRELFRPGVSGSLSLYDWRTDAIHLGGVVRAFWLIPILLVAVLVLAALDHESGLSTWIELRDQLRESEGRILQLRDEVVTLQSEVRDLADDPLAMERAIREVLELARPGETVVRFVDQGDGPTARLN